MPDNLTPDPPAEHEPAAKRYNCATGMVARYAIEHGMKGALARLRRELPPDQ